MARARTDRTAALAFDTITIEGALIVPAMLARIAQHQAGGQAEADYGIPKGLTIRDEIARYFRIGQAMFRDLTASETPSLKTTINIVEKLLHDVFGFGDIRHVGTRTLGERQFTVTLECLGGRVPVVVVPPAEDIDSPSIHLTTDGKRRSAASALQDWLNAADGALWGLCTNGMRLRLTRDNASLTRPAYVEADLRRIFEADLFADFAALWLLLHASRFGVAGTLPSDCALERWRDAGQKEGVAARERLRDGVEAALLTLGNGFLSHPGNAQLRERVQTSALPLPEFFNQLLRLVYRLIFLLAAEDRNLLHPPEAAAAARKLYAEGYSVGVLRDQAVRRSARDRHHDRWEGLLITFLALARGEKRLGLPALGGLFAPDVIPDLETVRLANRSLMAAIFRLAWLREQAGLVPVNWRDMETEELGSVYESLLELTPQLKDNGHAFAFAEGGEAKGHARKASGSYYTPDSLVQALLDSALDPVLDRVEAEANDPAASLLSITVLDPACGSGHFLLAAARRIATRLARIRAGGVAALADYRHALRDVSRACIHGVDRNPMAVELTKVALWIETVEPGKPLGFLDANIRCGDSLLGVFDLKALALGIPDAAYKPLAGDDKETAKHFEKRNKADRKGQGNLDFTAGSGRLPAAAPMAEQAKELRLMPEDSPEQIAAKQKAFTGGLADPQRRDLRIAADLYVAAFLVPKTGSVSANHNAVTIPTTSHVWTAVAGKRSYGPLLARAQELARAAHAFHWPLEFPDIMAAGGFDVVLGNPPWDVIQLGEEEYFAQRLPEIAELPGAARKRAIAALQKENPSAFASYQMDKRRFEAANEFARACGTFVLTARGKINTYALFAELFAHLTSKRGRGGVIVPTGIAHADTNKLFFAYLLDSKRLRSMFGFYEVRFWFLETDDKSSFCLLTIGYGNNDPVFVFDAKPIQDLLDERRRFTLSAKEIARINPNTRTAPVFRSWADAELTAKIYARVPVLIDETNEKDGNRWGIEFRQGLFNMTSDSGLFRTAAQLQKAGFVRSGNGWVEPKRPTNRQGASSLAGESDERTLSLQGAAPARILQPYVPLYEAKMIHHFDHRWATYDGMDCLDTSEAEKADPNYESTPRYWVLEREVTDRLVAKGWSRGWLIGWRDIARNSDVRTVISAAFPRLGVGNKIPLMFPGKEWQAEHSAALIGCFSSLVLDYCARQKLGGTTLNFFILFQFPVYLLPFIQTMPSPSLSRASSNSPTPATPWRRSRATSATKASRSPGTRTAARTCAPNSTPGTRVPMGSRATSYATSSTPPA
jgi:hypothetical protein